MDSLCGSSIYHRCWNFKEELLELKGGSLDSIFVVTEAEISLVLVKSEFVHHFLSNNFEMYNQQCKNERTSFYREGVDLLVYS